jgi:hypothetical protein
MKWDFFDVNPPVCAWAAIRVFELDGGTDFKFLASTSTATPARASAPNTKPGGQPWSPTSSFTTPPTATRLDGDQ